MDRFVLKSVALFSTWTWCWQWACVGGTLLDKPHDFKVFPGTPVVLRCASDLPYPIDWVFITKHGIKHEIYSSGEISPSFSSQFAVEKSGPGIYNLKILSASKKHEGQYTCIDNEGLLNQDAATATVKIIANAKDDLPLSDPNAEAQKQETKMEESVPTTRLAVTTVAFEEQSEDNTTLTITLSVTISILIIFAMLISAGCIIYHRKGKTAPKYFPTIMESWCDDSSMTKKTEFSVDCQQHMTKEVNPFIKFPADNYSHDTETFG